MRKWDGIYGILGNGMECKEEYMEYMDYMVYMKWFLERRTGLDAGRGGSRNGVGYDGGVKGWLAVVRRESEGSGGEHWDVGRREGGEGERK